MPVTWTIKAKGEGYSVRTIDGEIHRSWLDAVSQYFREEGMMGHILDFEYEVEIDKCATPSFSESQLPPPLPVLRKDDYVPESE
jgi:hypothetical protein